MRHRMRRSWQAWADLGVGRQVVDMIRNGVCIPFKNGPPAPFNQGVSMEDATPDQLRFMDDELARFLASGAWEEGHCSQKIGKIVFTVKCRGKLYRLAGLPMGWSMSPHYFCSLTAAFNRHLRRPDFAVTSQGVRRAKLSMGRRQALRSHFRGCRMLPYMDFMFFASRRRAQFLFLAIKPARFYLRKLHDVLRTKDS
eukprot:jgi/Tetstr1/437281/TSEL_026010.t1